MTNELASIRAVRFSTTTAAVLHMGGPPLPWAFTVSVREGRIEFAGVRRPAVVWDLPASSVVALTVRETTSKGWAHRHTMPAIVFTISTADGLVELPVVPTSDDGRRLLTWKENEVRVLARRLETAIGAQRAG